MKLLRLFGIVFFTATILFGTLSCKATTSSHIHTFAEEWSYDETHHWHAATCEHINELSEKAAHSWDTGVVTKDPTKTKAGEKEFTCTVCKKTRVEEIPATGSIPDGGGQDSQKHEHTFATEWSFDETHHWHIATCEHDVISEKTEHTTETKITKDATCETKGEKTITCSVCSKTTTEDIPATGHKWDNGTETKKATETEDGEMTFTCASCNTKKIEIIPSIGHEHTFATEWTFDETHHWYAADCENSTHTKNYEKHNTVTRIKTKATCTTDGETETYCTVCDHVISTTKISATGHKYSSDWKSDENSHWHPSTCEHTLKKDEASHFWDAGVVTTEPTLTQDGEKTFTCKVCERTKTESIKYVPTLADEADDEIDGTKISATEDGWPIWTYSLSEYSGSVTIEFSAEVAVENTNNEAEILYWKVLQDGYQTIASQKFEPGTTNWTTVTGTENIVLEENKVIYIPKPSTDKLKIYIKNVSVTVTEYIDLSDAEKTILGSNPPSSWQLWNYSLNDYKDKTVSIIFSMDVAVENGNEDPVNLLWQINTDGYPTPASHEFAAGTTGWTKISGKIEDLEIKEAYKSLYINLPTGADKLTVYLKNVQITVIPTDDVETIDGSDSGISWAFKTYDLSAYNNKTVKITFSVNMKVENSGEDPVTLKWQVNNEDEGYPLIVEHSFESDTSDWVTLSANKIEVKLGTNNLLYLSTNELPKEKLKISLANIVVKVIDPTSRNWLVVESLKEAYVDSGIFDHIGLAVERKEIFNPENSTNKITDIAEGLRHHVNSITMGNEFKPQWILWEYSNPSHNTTFTSTAFDKDHPAKTISVPDCLPSSNDAGHGFDGIDTCLQYCKDNGIQMRGHVLTWHSQTFDWFFREDYDMSKGLVDKATMTARHEWYIKTVLEHVTAWETANNYRAIYSWDVVNEAVADDATQTNYLRGSTSGTNGNIVLNGGKCIENTTSHWYKIYGDDEFIVNAFRFANKYAPSDVTLCYNDYNEYQEYGGGYKRSGIKKVLQSVLNHKNDATLPTRIDAFAMQSHFAQHVPLSDVEYTIQEYLKLDLDLQVSELDYAYNSSSSGNYAGKTLADLYSSYFKVYQKYAKSRRGTNGITSVTIWGIEDSKTWLNNASNTYYPLLFERDSNSNLVAKDAFFAVIDAAGKTN